MENPGIDDLRRQITELEERAALLSAMRSQLHHQIDFGFESATTRDREREVSNERIDLFRRIDALKEALRLREAAA